MPTYNTREDWLRRAIGSVTAQLYPHWELCIADDASTDPSVVKVIEDFVRKDARIRLTLRSTNGGIAAASNSALSMATGEFVALLDHDDELAPDALFHVAREINAHPDVELIYTDEDKIDPQGLRCDPYFKSDWNYDLFLSHNLITHLAVYRTARLRALGGFREGFDGAQDYDLALRFIADLPERRIRHIPRLLYHWRKHPDSTAHSPAAKSHAPDAARRAIADHLRQRGIEAEVLPAPQAPQCHRVKYALPSARASRYDRHPHPQRSRASEAVRRQHPFPHRLQELRPADRRQRQRRSGHTSLPQRARPVGTSQSGARPAAVQLLRSRQRGRAARQRRDHRALEQRRRGARRRLAGRDGEPRRAPRDRHRRRTPLVSGLHLAARGRHPRHRRRCGPCP